MSSVIVRDTIKDFLTDNAPTEMQVDLTLQYGEIKEMLQDMGIAPGTPWLGLEFFGDTEDPVSVPATNSQGKYRESGAIYFHVVAAAQLGVGNSLLTRGETLRNLFRGQRIGDVVIESVSPMNFSEGATLSFQGGWMSGSFVAAYEYDKNL